VGSSAIDAYVVGSGADGRAGTFRGLLNVRPVAAASAAFSLSRHRDTPHHVLDARSGLRTVGRFARGNAAPVVATFHEATDAAGRPPTWLHERVTAAILVAESHRAAFGDRFPAERTFVVPYGVDTDHFVPAATPASDRRVAVPRAACDEALVTRVTALTLAQVPDATFTRVKGGDSSRLDTYQRATVALFPATRDAPSRALLEAMATGTAIIATDVGGVREYVDRAGILVAPDDAAALADALVRVVLDRDLATELGRRARERARHFDLVTAADRHRAIYRWCARTQGSRRA
jgi:glycosyltransferase involved in cell wall biosynthesis